MKFSFAHALIAGLLSTSIPVITAAPLPVDGTTSLQRRVSGTKPAPKPAVKPASNPPAKPASNPPAKPASNPAVKPPSNPAAKPAPNPAMKPPSNPAVKPPSNPAAKPAPNPAIKPPSNPAAKPAPNPAVKPTVKPASSTAPKPGTKPPGKKCRRASDSEADGAETCTLPAGPLEITPEMCAGKFRAGATDKVLFWSKLENESAQATNDVSFLKGYEVLSAIWQDRNYPNEYKDDWTRKKPNEVQGAMTKFWAYCSEALAGLAKGTVYIMMPKQEGVTGLNWGKSSGSFWALHEFPTICRNTHVTKLVRLHYDATAGDTTTIEEKLEKEDITEAMLALRNAGNCPTIPSLTSRLRF